MQGFLVFIIALGTLIFVHELGHFIMARLLGVSVPVFSIGFGPKLLKIKGRQTEYAISLIPLGGYVSLKGERRSEAVGSADEFATRPVSHRIAIIAAGPVVNYIFAIFLFTLVYVSGAPELLNFVGEVKDGMPASSAGIQKGDRIVSLDGREVALWDEIVEYIHDRPGQKIRIGLMRDGSPITVEVEPKLETLPTLFGEEKKVGLIGIAPDPEHFESIRLGPVGAFKKAVWRAWNTTKMIFEGLVLLFMGNKYAIQSMSGPVGIYAVASQAWQMGFAYFLYVFAIVSVSLAVFNILPIPILDGGHILFGVIEGIIRRPIPDKAVDAFNNAGLFLLLALFVFVFYNDIRRFVFHKDNDSAYYNELSVNEVVNELAE